MTTRAMIMCLSLQTLVISTPLAVADNDPPVPDNLHDEKPNMPYIRTDGPQVLSGPLPGDMLRVGPFQSVQVNVAGNGMNIVGDAANEPSIAFNPVNPSEMAVGWRQFDTIQSDFRQAGFAFSDDGGATWTFPGVFTPGNFRSDPILETDSSGRFYYNSLRSNFDCDFFFSTNGGQTWTGPQFAFGGDKAWFTIDKTLSSSDGNIYVAWSRFVGCCGLNTFTRSFNGGASFRSPQFIAGAPLFGTLDVGPNGEVYVCGRPTTNSGEIVVSRSFDAKDPAVGTANFTSSTVMAGIQTGIGGVVNPVGLAGQSYVCADISNGPNRGNVYVLGSIGQNDDPLDVMFARSTDQGATWSTPIRVNHFNEPNDDSIQWFGMMDVAPNGRIDVLWNDTRVDPGPQPQFSQLRYSASFDGGLTWRYDIPVAPEFNHTLGYPVQQKIGDYYDLKSDEDGTNVIYSATFNGEQDVYYLRVAFLDCNNNGTLDVDEIDAGMLADCNGNDLPDDCELATEYALDCNANNVPDDCDIASGFDPDCDGNGVPDSCDIASGEADDCDGNGVPDACDLAMDASRDCNANGVLDTCDIASGASPDCNNNGIPDECDLSGAVIAESPMLSPIGAGNDQMHLFQGLTPAIGTVTITIEGRGDFNIPGEFVSVIMNGTPLGDVFVEGSDCSPQLITDTIEMDATAFNNALNGGGAEFNLEASDLVDPLLCMPLSSIRVRLEYAGAAGNSSDKNNNGIPDECEQLLGDLNCDGFISVSDIGPFVLALTDPAGYATQFPNCDINLADLNNDNTISVSDIGPFVALLQG